MNERREAASRLVAALAIVTLVGGCGTGAGPTPSAATPATPGPTVVPTSVPASTPRPTPSVVVTRDIAYESSNPTLTPGLLDVYAPVKAGPWPLVVMLPANSRYFLSEHARKVADLGFVVFVAMWHMPSSAPTYDLLLAIGSQAACAVEFARAKGADYGGDPGTLILFGHSKGASTASIVAFARPAPSPACLGNSTLGEIDALVTWDGEWLAQTTFFGWDEILASDPRIFDALTPWTDLPAHKDLRVAMLSETDAKADFNYDRPLPDEAAMDAFFGPRDPTGALRAQLEANGALADGVIDMLDAQQLLYSMLKAQGNPVTLDVMPDTNHVSIGNAGMPVFLAAFEKAAGRT